MMEKNAYTMATLGLNTKDGLQPKQDCGFYMKYFFLFLSIIQFLIILGLVLFMIFNNSSESTEKYTNGLKSQLQESNKNITMLKGQIDNFKHQINATEKEGRLVQFQMLKLNNSLKTCNIEKTKLKELQLSNSAALLEAHETKHSLKYLNITCIANVLSLQKQLETLELKSQMEREHLKWDSKSWQEKTEKAEKEKNECQLDKLELQTREQKYQELKTTLVQALDPVLKNLRASADQFFSSCYLLEVENTFHSMFRTLQGQLEKVAQQVDQKANEVAHENAVLQSQKAACKQHLQEREQQISLQQQQFEWQKKVLQDSHETQAQKIRAECRKMLDENESLKLQLQQTRQACISMRVNRDPDFCSSWSELVPRHLLYTRSQQL